MIQIDAQAQTAHNTETGGRCFVVYVGSLAFTNIAGLIALEEGKHSPKHIRNTVTNWQRHATEEMNALKPCDFNGIWLYNIAGWDVVRERIKIQSKVAK